MEIARFKTLGAEEGSPVGIERPDGKSPVLLICEHASARLPSEAGDLGLSAEALSSHVAWDPGALAVARAMSEALDATLVYQRFSRLIYDCNRPPESPGAIPERSEVYDIPGNCALSEDDRRARVEALYLPFHETIRSLLSERAARGAASVIVTIHSFTPVYFGKPRSVELGILHDSDSRLADRMLEAAAREPIYRTERNQPYGPEDGVTHTLRLHGLANNLPNVMIEVRNDLIGETTGQGVMAGYLVGLLQQALDG